MRHNIKIAFHFMQNIFDHCFCSEPLCFIHINASELSSINWWWLNFAYAYLIRPGAGFRIQRPMGPKKKKKKKKKHLQTKTLIIN